MSRQGDLDVARENCGCALAWALDDLDSGARGGAAFFDITRAYRRLAACALLAEADTDQFRVLLAQSGHAHAHFLTRVQQGGAFEARYYATSTADPFSDALAAGDLDTARAIASLSPAAHFPDLEYEDDFLRNHTLHRLLLDPEDRAGIEALLARWGEVLEGGSSVFYDVTRALAERDPRGFEGAFDGLIERRAEVVRAWRGMTTHDPEIDATEGAIFVEALAILRLAELRGLPTRPDYRFAPDIARIPLGLPLPPAGAWQVP